MKKIKEKFQDKFESVITKYDALELKVNQWWDSDNSKKHLALCTVVLLGIVITLLLT
jgi:hypothetical protein